MTEHRCNKCGTSTWTTGPAPQSCSTCDVQAAFAGLSAKELTELDRLLIEGQTIAAHRLVRRSSGNRDLGVAMLVVAERTTHLKSIDQISPQPLPTVEELKEILSQQANSPHSIVAEWDGDTTGWFVSLRAVLMGGPNQSLGLADVRLGGDFRLFTNKVPPWPEATVAAELGAELARQLGVPFQFEHPEGPPRP